jgi:hypothetical protein|tara:strand:- start:598 stop:804 length:207 start_codon:yes stop_codon:yes gene_type:complete
MTYEDAFLLSVGVNIGLVYLNHRINTKYHEMGLIFTSLLFVVKGVADKDIDLKKDSEGNICIKEKTNG